MDHKISKDLISSGMTPSGEKSQADLGRTQYGSAPSPSKLMDAYKSMYDKKEEVINEHHKKDADGNVTTNMWDGSTSPTIRFTDTDVDQDVITISGDRGIKTEGTVISCNSII